MGKENNVIDISKYYSSQGKISDPDGFSKLFYLLPHKVADIVEIIHGLFLHPLWADDYGVTLNADQKEHVQSRSMKNILSKIMEIDDSSFEKPRSYENRFYGNCRDHTLFLTSVLRSKGIPSRARCGFAGYFQPGKYMDHWICEYFDNSESRWISVDSQLDDLQKKALKISFNVLNIPEGKFVSGAKAWNMCRQGKADPKDFGILDMWGLWMVRGNLVRDIAALNKMELLPFDVWGIMRKNDEELTSQDYDLLDLAAKIVENDDKDIFLLYNSNNALTVPNKIGSYIFDKGFMEVDLF